MLDIKKAFLQIHVAPELLQFQTVLWQGCPYVMAHMGFGMNVAPKVMDRIVQWIVQPFPTVDNYVDDVVASTASAHAVSARLAKYGLPTKPVEPLVKSCGLGLSSSVAMKPV